MQYTVFGRSEPDAPTVMLSSGLGGLGSFWKPQFAALQAHFRVVIYDHSGTGANGNNLPMHYTISDMTDDVVDILDNAGIEDCHFVGHALGGHIGIDLALRSPTRLKSLTLVNGWAALDAHTRRCFETRIALLNYVGVTAFVHAQPIFLYPAAWLSQHRDRMDHEEKQNIAHFQGTETITRRINALMAFDVAEQLPNINVPTLIAAARDDVLVPYICSQQLADGIPNSTLWLTDEGGHACTVSDPEPFNTTLLDFISLRN